MANPYVTHNKRMKGIWLIPHRGGRVVEDIVVFVRGTFTLRKPLSSAVFENPTRPEKIIQLGRLHGHEGIIQGQLFAFTSTRFGSITSAQQAVRLRNLIRKQRKHRIEIRSTVFHIPQVTIMEGYDINPAIMPDSGVKLYEINIPFIQTYRPQGHGHRDRD